MSFSPFYLWLESQVDRRDVVGDYARRSIRTNTYPRLSERLHLLLKYETERHRPALKLAHREWRQHRKTQQPLTGTDRINKLLGGGL